MEPGELTGLVRRAARGEQSAWQTIVDEYGRLVWSVARGYRLSEAQTADAVQTTWLRLLEHLAEIREPDRLPGWLRTTAQRVCLAMLRDERREEPTGSCERQLACLDSRWPLAREAGPEECAVRRDHQVLVRRAVATLPARHRALLRLLASSPSISYREISAGLGMPVGSIGPTRARILARLRVELETAGVYDTALN